MTAFWPIRTAQIIRIVSYPISKSPDSDFFACMYRALLPKTDYRDKERGHDRRLGGRRHRSRTVTLAARGWGGTTSTWREKLWSAICFKIMARFTCGFSHVYMQSSLLHNIREFFCHVYLRSFLLCGVFIPKYMTIFIETRVSKKMVPLAAVIFNYKIVFK